ncbi:hypothetical protein H7992_14315 [Sporosarcina sp. resist]|uniref:DUF7210 family protein n=1 Tax=Sporosarcina sp. resist TaxID=2762563 RepID=UPI00164E9164|nr:hypothetical protein [Sporosarcina sp. resist]QNK86433.1 hypothetical protein H7992_14315 [Sporosarcina sp. resist]
MAKKRDEEVLETKTQEVVFNTNVKHGKALYKKGESLEASEAEYEVLLKAGVIYEAN